MDLIYMENPDKQRYYLLFIEQDLFKTWCLIKSFGSLVSRRGRTIVQVCANKSHASEMLFEAESKKRQRGYVYSDFPQDGKYHLRPQTIKEVINNKANLLKEHPAPAIIYHHNPDQLELF